jgi:hypothetical protein
MGGRDSKQLATQYVWIEGVKIVNKRQLLFKKRD